MSKEKLIDHLFRHQYGKMVAILTRIFGLEHLELIEDAVQDTFIVAMKTWPNQMPEQPEAWLTKAAKNRMLDLLRKLKAEQKRVPNFDNGPAMIAVNELFLDTEIEDSQLRMIFTACNPALQAGDQIAFALKTISGFSQKEIAGALLLKEETVKKRLSRARKVIQRESISFQIPQGKELPQRLEQVLKVIYLIFNEGFYSNRKQFIIREDLCGEAIRLNRMLLSNELTASHNAYALFALLCFQSARLRSKVDENNEIISLEFQDRSLWYRPLIRLGHQAMHRAVETEQFSTYHYEAAIVAEHLKAVNYASTDWDKILLWYEKLQAIERSAFNLLNMAVVHIQRGDLDAAEKLLIQIVPDHLEQRAYLYYGSYAEFFHHKGADEDAMKHLSKAIDLAQNSAEKKYLLQKQLNFQKN